jgi:hypothetical protein
VTRIIPPRARCTPSGHVALERPLEEWLDNNFAGSGLILHLCNGKRTTGAHPGRLLHFRESPPSRKPLRPTRAVSNNLTRRCREQFGIAKPGVKCAVSISVVALPLLGTHD